MTKQIRDNIEKFVKSIDEELSVTFICGVGSYLKTDTNTINIDYTETDDYGFMRHLKEIHKCDFTYDYSLILWTMLHEIGHYETEWELLEEDDEALLRFWLSFTSKKDAHNIVIQDKYYNLTAEWYATEWAIQWISGNSEKAKELNKLF